MSKNESKVARTAEEATAQELAVPDFSEWVQFAYTVDGYSLADDLGIDIYALAQRMMGTYRETGEWRGTRMELRLVLFYVAREVRFAGGVEDTPDHVNTIRALLTAIGQS